MRMSASRQEEEIASSQQVDPKSPTEPSGGEMSLTEHLGELRTRLIRACIGVIIGMLIAFFFIDEMVAAIIRLAAGYNVQAIAPTETFSSYLKLVFMAGIAFAMPMIIYQLFAFVSPGLTRRERNFILSALPFVMLLFVSGVVFGYFLVIPNAIRFLYGFGSGNIEKNIRFSLHISFVTNLLLWIGISFETPAVVYTLIKTRIVSAAKLSSIRRFVAVGILVAAAVITPTPDPFNMMLVAVPMYVLYELGIFLGRVA